MKMQTYILFLVCLFCSCCSSACNECDRYLAKSPGPNYFKAKCNELARLISELRYHGKYHDAISVIREYIEALREYRRINMNSIFVATAIIPSNVNSAESQFNSYATRTFERYVTKQVIEYLVKFKKANACSESGMILHFRLPSNHNDIDIIVIDSYGNGLSDTDVLLVVRDILSKGLIETKINREEIVNGRIEFYYRNP